MNLKPLVIIIIATIFNPFQCKAQIKKDSLPQIILDLTIKLNDSIRDDIDYEVSITDFNSGHSNKYKAKSNTYFRLDYNRVFEIEFTCKDCSTVIIDVETYAPIDNWSLIAKILLTTSNQNKKRTGKIFYSEKEKNFTRKTY